MAIRYDDSDQAEELARRARTFMDEVVLSVERKFLGDGPVPASVIDTLRDEAREYDIYAPQIESEYGGMGMSFRDALPVFEEAGRSMLGPPAMRVDGPDEGTMHLLELVGTDAQKEEYLRPLVAGKIKSAFSMTEPLQGGGSDPKMIKTSATRDGDEWIINGHKWWTSQGTESDVLVVLARTDHNAHPYEGSSLFLVPKDADGINITREIPHMADEMIDMSHVEVIYEDVRVSAENLLGERNEGFTHAQQRLGPARLTHCMRYSGRAKRALNVAKQYMSIREGFGSPIAEKQAPRFEIADAETRLHAARTMVRHAANQISNGYEARTEVAMCKVFTANVVQDAVDTALQFCGAHGIGKDLPISDFYENVRRFRIVDGPDEVHRRVIARDTFDEVETNELECISRYHGEG
jgi:acyl-CoA dehydrogenase